MLFTFTLIHFHYQEKHKFNLNLKSYLSILQRGSTCFPELPVPEHGHDDQQVPDNIHHDGRDQDAGQNRHHPGEGLVLLTGGVFFPRRRGVAGQQGPRHHGGLMVLQGHQLRQVPRIDESHRVVVVEGRSMQHNARRLCAGARPALEDLLRRHCGRFTRVALPL